MSALPSDFIQVEDKKGTLLFRALCLANGLDWPPPLFLVIGGAQYRRQSYSSISDDVAVTVTHVARGALYTPDDSIVADSPKEIQ